MVNNQLKIMAFVIGCSMVFGCSGKHLEVQDNNKLALAGCNPLPNCVSSTTLILYNRTSPFELLIPHEEAWPKIKEVVADIPRTEIVEESDIYIHAKCKSRVFRFVDNLELLLHPDQGKISVRSSSVIAIFDLFVNRWRIYKLRKQLAEMEIIKE
jgi:uncharacterized protein (DUF1499 family)